MTPIVAVVSDTLMESGYHWHAGKDSYLSAAFEVAGVLPLLIPAFGEAIDFDGLLARVDGVMLTGHKSNVHPQNYGEAETPKHEPFDRSRDATSLPLVRKAVALGVPLFAICRGIQEMNVALGGTLGSEIQERPGIDDHREPDTPDLDARYLVRHDVAFAEEGQLATLFGDLVLPVNSLHRQAVDEPGSVLQIEARAPDGTIEAVSVIGAKAFALGVQWHPEYWARTDWGSRRLFEAFGDAVRAYAATKN
ncbi:MAG: gamma-glutamyl-gamma-aminobutyrate hydrolase family protein, partial [Pseudomonadota bacterium]